MDKYYRSSQLADVEVVFTVASTNQKSTRAAKRAKLADLSRFPAHKLCLSSSSSVLEAEIDAGAKVLQVCLDSSEDVPAADAMFAAMYEVQDALQQLDQPGMLRLAVLANKYDAPKVLSTAVQKLSAQSLEAATLDLMWQLPGCWEQPLWQLLPQAIQHKMASSDSNKAEAVTDLLLFVCDRDLEAVWTDSSSVRRDLLMNLPADVLTAFLKSPELRVISEDTVLYTVARRIEAMDKARPGLDAAAAKQQQELLVSAVRLPQLTQVALSFIAPNLQWLDQKKCQLAGFAKHCSLEAADMGVPAEWQQDARSSSNMTSHTVELKVSLDRVQAACSQALAARDAAHISTVASNSFPYGGRDWRLMLCASKEAEGPCVFLYAGASAYFLGRDFIPWHGADATLRCGPECATKIDKYKKTPFVLVVARGMASAEAWTAPDWAEGGNVIVQLTLQSSACC